MSGERSHPVVEETTINLYYSDRRDAKLFAEEIISALSDRFPSVRGRRFPRVSVHKIFPFGKWYVKIVFTSYSEEDQTYKDIGEFLREYFKIAFEE